MVFCVAITVGGAGGLLGQTESTFFRVPSLSLGLDAASDTLITAGWATLSSPLGLLESCSQMVSAPTSTFLDTGEVTPVGMLAGLAVLTEVGLL